MKQTTGEKPARLCYNHIGGKLGARLLALFVDKGWIAKDKPTDQHLHMTGKGEKEFAKPGLDLSQIKSEDE